MYIVEDTIKDNLSNTIINYLLYLTLDVKNEPYIERINYDWNWGLFKACKHGHKDLAELMIEKGANGLNWGLQGACEGGHKALALYMIQKGADDWNYGLYGACHGGSKELALYMIQKGATCCNRCGNKKHHSKLL